MVIELKTNFTAKQILGQLNKRKRYWSKKAILLTLQTVGKEGVKELKRAAPKKSSKLKSSFGFRILKKGKREGRLVFTSTADYAQFVNDGTKPSEGGYIPAIERRLTRRYTRTHNIKSRKLKLHPGTKPNRYQARAAAQMRKKVLDKVIQAFRKVGKVQGGNTVT